MTKSYDRELLDTLTKTLTALDRIQNALAPLLEAYREQVRFMPPIPQGSADCPECAGTGILTFVDAETDLWTSRLCGCANV